MKRFLKEFPWKQYGISLVIVSLGALMIHAQQNKPVMLDQFFMWLPISWLGVFIMASGFILFLKEDKE